MVSRRVDDRGQDFFTRQAAPCHVLADALPNGGEYVSKGYDVFIFRAVPDFAKARVIPILFTPLRIAARRLDMPIRERALEHHSGRNALFVRASGQPQSSALQARRRLVLVTMQRVSSTPLRVTLRRHASITSRFSPSRQTLSADAVRSGICGLRSRWTDRCSQGA